MGSRSLTKLSLMLVPLLMVCIRSHAESFMILNERFGVECRYSVNEHGLANSEDSGPKGSGVCWDIDMMKKADKFIKENGLEKDTLQNKGVRLIKASFRACALGSSTKLTPYEKILAYAKISSEFKGDADSINRVSASFEKGKNAIGVADYKFCQNVAISP